MVWHDTRICPCLSRSITGRANRTEKVMNFVVIFFKKEIDEFLSNMFWNHQDLRRAFEWYASLVISPPIPSNESWTLSKKVAGISQAACRREPGQGGQNRWTALLQTLQYHAIHAGTMPRGGRYEAGHRLGSDRQQECRLPFASAVSSVLILTDAELDRGRSTVLHLTSNLPH